jgi:hypothetical protein
MRWALGLGLLAVVLYRRRYQWLAGLALKRSLTLLRSPAVTSLAKQLGYAHPAPKNTRNR